MSTSEPGSPVPAAALSNPDADILEALLDGGETVALELELDCGFDGLATSYNVIAEYDGRETTEGFVAVGGHGVGEGRKAQLVAARRHDPFIG